MLQLDMALFAFASYNAGVGRIAKLRRIGAETVTYVANIYKYYIAYKLMMEVKEERVRATDKMKGERKGRNAQ